MKKIYTLIFMLFILMHQDFLFAESKIDSLETILKIQIHQDTEKIKILNELSSAYLNKSPEKCIEYGNQALTLARDLNNKKQEAVALKNISKGYDILGDKEKSLEYYLESLKVVEENIIEMIKDDYLNLSKVYSATGDNEKALEYYKLYSKMKDTLLIKDVQKKYETKEKKKEVELLKRDKAIQDLKQKQMIYETELKEKEIETREKEKEIEILKKDKAIQDLKLAQVRYEAKMKEKEIEILKRDKEIKELELSRQRSLKRTFIAVSILILSLAFVIYNRYRFKAKANNIIKFEKEKSEKLLLNILPVRVANELKETGKTEPESFENVTVYFSDIVSFTKISSVLEPKLLIDELNEIFTAFDNIIEKNHCERIKTIGDAYLAVCGMPERNENHAENIVRSAIEIIEYLEERNKNSKIEWQIRIGIHTGKLVGGIVGIKKYIYDVFGDTINTAFRVESNSEPMKINVSESTYNIVKEKFNFLERGTIEVKGKGKMKMYFINVGQATD